MKTLFRILISLLSVVFVGAGDYYLYSTLQNDKSNEIIEAIESETEETAKKYSKIIFFGDSRFEFMAMETEEEENFVTMVAQGYDWMCENLDTVFEKYTEDSVILIEFGVNDLGNIDLYIEKINELAEMGYNIAYLTIMPVDEEKEKAYNFTIKNQDIEKFNQRLKSELDSRIIILDGYEFLCENGFESVDGLHYLTSTNVTLYEYINEQLKITAE